MAYRISLVQQLAIIIASPLLLPLYTFLALFSRMVAPFTPTSKHIYHHRRWRALSSSTFRPRTILVTGIASAEGLALARIFYRAGHQVIGVDFEPYRIPVSGRFSVSISKFYRLQNRPIHIDGVEPWCQELVGIVKRERAELLVCCCNEKSYDLFTQATDAVEELTGCKTIQFSASLTENLLKPEYFFEETLSLGLNVLETNVNGPKYLCQSLIIYGQVLTFTSCRAPTESIQIRALPPSSAISVAMLECTSVYAKEFGKKEAGNFSLTFVLDADDPEPDLRKKLYPIKCNPGIAAPVVLFSSESEDTSEAYCSILSDHEPKDVTYYTEIGTIVMPEPSTGTYWLGDCLYTLFILPLIDFGRMRIDVWNFLASWVYFLELVLFWKECLAEIWDPWVAWWQYGTYQPLMAFIEVLMGRH